MTRRLLLSSALGLVAVALAGGARVPLYDGVGFPDEPYRYVVWSGPGQPAPPNPVQQTVPSGQLADTNLALQSTETGPQVLLNVSAGGITVPSGATAVTISATPLAPDTPPDDGKLAGNIYQLQVVSQPGPPKIDNKAASVRLRLPGDITFHIPPVVEYRSGAGAKWQRVSTIQTGADVYQGAFAGVGDYVLVIDTTTGDSPSARQSQGPPTLLWLLLGVGLVVVVGAFVAIRVSGEKPQRR